MTSCQDLFTSSGLTGISLQTAVEDRFCNGECEKVAVSPFSPGPVIDDECLTRLVFHPIHVHPHTGIPVSMAFADAWSSDLSVFREEQASDVEITLAIDQMKATGAKKAPPQQRAVVAAMSIGTGRLRAEVIGKHDARAFRVYDTAEEAKPHHASVFLSKVARSEMTEKSSRKRLFELFSSVANYRAGRLANIPSSA